MGKQARKARRAAGPRVQAADAMRLVELGRMCARPAEGDLWRRVATVVDAWDIDRVVARADPDLVGALVTTDRDCEPPPDCLQRFPFQSLAVSLPDEGGEPARCPGFFVAGLRWAANGVGANGESIGLARPVPIPEADGVEIVWPLADLDPDPPMVGAHRLTWWFQENPTANGGSINDLITRLRDRNPGFDPAYDHQIPLAVLVLLYLCATEPDLDEIPPQRLVRPQPLQGAEVHNLGWRVGAQLRAALALRSGGEGTGGWSVAPHMRSAHFRRSRIVARDGQRIVGTIQGAYGTDWHYRLNWMAPTPVNCGPDGPAEAVRPIGPRSPGRGA